MIAICRGYSFHCDNMRCIGWSSRCNGDNDCGDGTDERDCDQGARDYLDKQSLLAIVTASLSVPAIIAIALLPCIIPVTIAVTFCVCAFNKKCPLYKYRHRHQSAIREIVADIQADDQCDTMQQSI